MNDKTKGALVALGCVSMPVLILVSVVWGGIVLSIVWNWFMPTIFGLPQLSIIQAMAASLVIGFLTKEHVPPKEEEENPLIGLIKVVVWPGIILPLFFLVMGFILKLFMP